MNALFHHKRCGHTIRITVQAQKQAMWDRVRIPCECGATIDPWYFQAIKGHVSQSTKCDRKCTSAIRPNCTCECGGENHGSDHSDYYLLAVNQR